MSRLSEGIILGDGGYIVELEQRGWVKAGAFTPEVTINHPSAVRELHAEMANAGAEVLQVMAFYGSRAKLETVGEGERTMEINRAATRIAKDVACNEILVAGNLSTTWKWEDGNTESNQLAASMFDEQIEAQEDVDFFIGETFHHLGEALLCLERVKAKSKAPSMITMSFRSTIITQDGFPPSECAKRLAGTGAEIVGVNCMRDPERTYPIIEKMRSATDAFIAAQPVAYRCSDEVPWFTGSPAFPDRLEPTRLTRFDMGNFATRAKNMGVNYIGSCCGSGAQHVREMGKALGKVHESPVWVPNPDNPMSDTEFNWERIKAE